MPARSDLGLGGAERQSQRCRISSRIQEFGTGIILTSQGIPFISEGDEFLRDKSGNSNSFNVEAPNVIHWDLRVTHEDVLAYVKNTVALRRAHGGFRMTSWEEVNRNIVTTLPRYDVLVNDIKAAASGDSWSEILVIYNSGDNFQFQLPAGTWQVAMERSQPVNQERKVMGSVVAEGTAVTVLHR